MLSLQLGSFFSTKLARHTEATEKSQQRLASGVRLNRSEDGPTDLLMADAMRAQVEGIRQASVNVQEASAILNITEDAVVGLMPVMQRMRELALTAANSDKSASDRNVIQIELDQLRVPFFEAYRNANTARVKLDSANASDRVLHFQVGANAGDVVSVDFNGLRSVLGEAIINFFGYEDIYNDDQMRPFLVPRFGSPPPPPNAPLPPTGTSLAERFPKKLVVNSGGWPDISGSVAIIEGTETRMIDELTYFGALSTRMELRVTQNAQIGEFFGEFESLIRDTDVAAEMSHLNSKQVMMQAAQAMLAQSNSRPQQVLELLNMR